MAEEKKESVFLAGRLSHGHGRESGISLIAMCFLIIATGLILTSGGKLYQSYAAYSASSVTDDSIGVVQNAMAQFLAENGRYPCPASLTEPVDGANFGREASTDCSAGAIAGTFRAPGDGGRMVRTGTIPTRTLGIHDEHMFDGYDRRYMYAVTEEYAIEGSRPGPNTAAILIVDDEGDQTTTEPLSQLILSTGWDDNGAFSLDGVSIRACDPAARSGENCDLDVDATFLNSTAKSTNAAAANMFVHTVSYAPPRPVVACDDSSDDDSGLPKDTTFLVDTSGSMGDPAGAGFCPAHMPGCSRIDVARWAMRRVMMAGMYNSTLMDDPGVTSMTGFLARNTTTAVSSALSRTDINFYDPADLENDADGDGILNREEFDEYALGKGAELESELQAMCPTGSTPLGIHIEALADRLGDGTSDRPNKITIISDGYNTNGRSPYDVAAEVRVRYPNIQVDIVDVAGNPGLAAISTQTGGRYFRTDNPDELIRAMMASAGICNPMAIPTPPDRPGCGSRGGWTVAGP